MNPNSLMLYIVTERAWLGKRGLSEVVEEVIQAGATFIQLREKNLDYNSFVTEAIKIKAVTDKYKTPFVINDNIDVFKAVDADGLHIGQNDICAKEARQIIGQNKILGVSVHTPLQAVKAQEDGADYIGVGAVFKTSTKDDANYVPYNVLKEICGTVTIPAVAIGGINKSNICELKGSGIKGVSVISAVFAAREPAAATRELYSLCKELI